MLKVSNLSFTTLQRIDMIRNKLTKGLKYLWTVIKWILITIGVLIATQIIGYAIGYGIGSAIMDVLQSAAQHQPALIS